MPYNLFYWIHIVSYITWLTAFAGSMFLAYKVGKTYQTESEGRFMQLERKITSIGAHIGALGILISGGAMASIPTGQKWGWFNFEIYSWLGVKQVIFFIILVLVGFSIKRGIAFKKQHREEEGNMIGEETRDRWNAAYRMSLVVYILVLVNTLLGLARPF